MRRITNQLDALGECPTWDARSARLCWIDVTGKRLSSCGETGENLAGQAVDDYPGSIALRNEGGLLVAFRRRLSIFDASGDELAKQVPAAIDFARERFNDGKCDSRGRFWVGTMDPRLKEQTGAVYRVDPDLSVRRVSEGYGVSNGFAWSPDERVLYHCDSSPTIIYAYDFDAEAGEVADRRVFVEFDTMMGRPDGCASDVDGFLWVASPEAGCIRRFDPDGKQERVLETPVRYPSSIAFGGSDLRTLFITSLVPHQLTAHDGANPELDGAVFATEVDVAGLPVGRFGG